MELGQDTVFGRILILVTMAFLIWGLATEGMKLTDKIMAHFHPRSVVAESGRKELPSFPGYRTIEGDDGVFVLIPENILNDRDQDDSDYHN